MDVYKSKSSDLLFKIETLIFVTFDDNPEEDLTWHIDRLYPFRWGKKFSRLQKERFLLPNTETSIFAH